MKSERRKDPPDGHRRYEQRQTEWDSTHPRKEQGSIEESNVNIAEELVNLIVAQRAFEANTRVISASDDMLRFVTQR